MVLSYAMEQVERLLVCAGEQAMRLVQLSEKTRNRAFLVFIKYSILYSRNLLSVHFADFQRFVEAFRLLKSFRRQ